MIILYLPSLYNKETSLAFGKRFVKADFILRHIVGALHEAPASGPPGASAPTTRAHLHRQTVVSKCALDTLITLNHEKL